MTMPHPDTESRPQMPALPTTLEELTRQKAELQRQILAQKATLARQGREMATPFAPIAEKGNQMWRAFNRGMAMFDGLMLGLRMMRKLKALFGKKKRYRY